MNPKRTSGLENVGSEKTGLELNVSKIEMREHEDR
jgi:hypothetical protein